MAAGNVATLRELRNELSDLVWDVGHFIRRAESQEQYRSGR
jgi:hypothetical protein